jgi:hypothetical protein
MAALILRSSQEPYSLKWADRCRTLRLAIQYNTIPCSWRSMRAGMLLCVPGTPTPFQRNDISHMCHSSAQAERKDPPPLICTLRRLFLEKGAEPISPPPIINNKKRQVIHYFGGAALAFVKSQGARFFRSVPLLYSLRAA